MTIVQKGCFIPQLPEGDYCFLYHIRRSCHKDILSEGYIGITKDPKTRLRSHQCDAKSTNPHLQRAMIVYKDVQMELITSGTRQEMLLLESYLRPKKGMGWNIEEGGGMPPTHSGFKLNPTSVVKREETRKTRPDRRNKPFLLYNPQGLRMTGRCANDFRHLIPCSSSSLSRLLKGEVSSVKGWTGQYLDDSYQPKTKPTRQPKPKPKPRCYARTLIAPNGTPHTFTNAKKFAKENDLCLSSVHRVLWGHRETTKGWSLEK